MQKSGFLTTRLILQSVVTLETIETIDPATLSEDGQAEDILELMENVMLGLCQTYSDDGKLSESRHEKTCLWGFRRGPKQMGCTATEDGQRLEVLDLGSRGIVLSM